jgi:polyhydroxyalkanoate synthesis regulator phasin
VLHARYYLTKAGLMDPPKNGVWRLTQEGNQTSLTTDQAKALVQKMVKEYQDSRKAKESSAPVKNEDVAIVEDEEHSEDLLDTLTVMSPKGFEPASRQTGASANACSPRSASTISRSLAVPVIKALTASAASA